MADLTTSAVVKTALNITGTADDARITALLTSVSAEVERYCRRVFAAADYTAYLRAAGELATVLALPQYPIVSVASVHVSTDVPRVYDATTLLDVDSDYLIEANSGLLYRVDGGYFPRAIQSVKVVWNGGYSTIPTDLQRAVAEIIGVKLEKGKGKLYHLTADARGEGSISGIRFDDWPESSRAVVESYRRPLAGL